MVAFSIEDKKPLRYLEGEKVHRCGAVPHVPWAPKRGPASGEASNKAPKY